MEKQIQLLNEKLNEQGKTIEILTKNNIELSEQRIKLVETNQKLEQKYREMSGLTMIFLKEMTAYEDKMKKLLNV